MSKKKNTLKDLDEFLKQQAAMLVSPDKLSHKVEPEESKPHQQATAESKEIAEEPASIDRPLSSDISTQQILESLKALHKKEGTSFNKNLCDLIIQSLETQARTSPEDKMLINTALYLKGGENWKEVIRDYWRNKI